MGKPVALTDTAVKSKRGLVLLSGLAAAISLLGIAYRATREVQVPPRTERSAVNTEKSRDFPAFSARPPGGVADNPDDPITVFRALRCDLPRAGGDPILRRARGVPAEVRSYGPPPALKIVSRIPGESPGSYPDGKDMSTNVQGGKFDITSDELGEQLGQPFRPTQGGYETCGPGYHVRVSPGGAAWTSGNPNGRPDVLLTGRSIRWGDVTIDLPSGDVAVEGNRARITHGQIDQEFIARRRGLEQDFIFPRPLGRGDLIVTVGIETRHAVRGSDRFCVQSIEFLSAAGRVATYHDAVALDANGRKTDVEMSLRGSEVLLRIPGDWLEGAAYPVRLDPVLGSEKSLGATGRRDKPDMVFNPLANEYLLTYEYYFSASDRDILLIRLDADGDFITSVTIAGTALDEFAPTVAFNPSTDELVGANGSVLVAWVVDGPPSYGPDNEIAYETWTGDLVTQFSDNLILESSSGEDWEPAAVWVDDNEGLAGDDDGFVIAWQGFHDTLGDPAIEFFKLDDTNGNPPAELAEVEITQGGNSIGDPEITYADNQNDVAVAYENFTTGTVWAIELDSKLAALLNFVAVSAGPSKFDPDIEANNSSTDAAGRDQYMVVWDDDTVEGIKARRLSGTMTLLDSEIAVSPTGGGFFRNSPRIAHSVVDNIYGIVYDQGTASSNSFNVFFSWVYAESAGPAHGASYQINSQAPDLDEYSPCIAWMSMSPSASGRPILSGHTVRVGYNQFLTAFPDEQNAADETDVLITVRQIGGDVQLQGVAANPPRYFTVGTTAAPVRGAMSDLSGATFTGPMTVELQANYTFPESCTVSGMTTSAANTLTIRPGTGNSPTVSAAGFTDRDVFSIQVSNTTFTVGAGASFTVRDADRTAANGNGVYLFANNCTVNGITATANDALGIVVIASSNNTVQNNTCNSNGSGIQIQDASTNTVTGNTCNSNTLATWSRDGIILFGTGANSATGNIITGNTCNSNGLYGIIVEAEGTATVSGGSVGTVASGNTTNSNLETGIFFYVPAATTGTISGVSIAGNTSNSNAFDGILLFQEAGTITGLTVDANTFNANNRHGINLAGASSNTVSNNRSSNAVTQAGIRVQLGAASNTVRHNVFWNNVDGVQCTVSAGSGNVFRNDTFYNNSDDAFDDDTTAGNQTLKNSILVITGAQTAIEGSPTASFNTTYSTATPTSAQPFFISVTPGSEDFHVQSTNGSFRNGGGGPFIDANNSTAIDTGDPADDYSLETQNRGTAINLGAYGNTAQASRSGTPGFVWTGGTSIDWGTSSNWNQGAGVVPNATSGHVLILGGMPFNPTFDETANKTIGSLRVNSGATLTLAEGVASVLGLWVGGAAGAQNFVINNGTLSLGEDDGDEAGRIHVQAGSLTNSGTITAATFGTGIYSEVRFNEGGTSATITLTSAGTFNADMNMFGGTVNLGGTITTGGWVAVHQGIFNIGANTLTVNGVSTLAGADPGVEDDNPSLVVAYNESVNPGRVDMAAGGVLDVNGKITWDTDASENITGGTIRVAGGWFDITTAGITLPNAVIAEFDTASAANLTSTASSAFGRFRVTGGTKTALTALDINENFELAGGTFAPGSFTHKVGANWIETSGGFAPAAGTVILDTDTAASITQLAANNFWQLQLIGTTAGLSKTVTLSSKLDVDQDFYLQNTSLSAGANAVTILGLLSVNGTPGVGGAATRARWTGTGSVTVRTAFWRPGSDGTISAGTWTVTGAGFSPEDWIFNLAGAPPEAAPDMTGSTVIFRGANDATVQTINIGSASTTAKFGHVQIGTGTATNKTARLTDSTDVGGANVAGSLTITASNTFSLNDGIASNGGERVNVGVNWTNSGALELDPDTGVGNGPGVVAFNGAGAQSIDSGGTGAGPPNKRFGRVIVAKSAGTATLVTNAVFVTQDLTITSGTLDLGTWAGATTHTVTQDATINGGTLRMTDFDITLDVNRDFIHTSGATAASDITGGVIQVARNVDINGGSFVMTAPAAAFSEPKILMDTATAATVRVTGASRLGTLRLEHTSSKTVTCNGAVNAAYLSFGTTSSGTMLLDVGGFEVDLTLAYRQTSRSQLVMTNAASFVAVAGYFEYNSASSTISVNMTSGVIEVSGTWDTAIAGASTTFAPTGGIVRFAPTAAGTQTVDIDAGDNFFNLEFSPSVGGVTWQLTSGATVLDVNGSLTINAAPSGAACVFTMVDAGATNRVLDLEGNFTLVTGTVPSTFAPGTATHTAGGSWDDSGGSFTATAGKITFDTTTAGTLKVGAANAFFNFEVAKSTGSLTVDAASSAVDVDGTVTLTSGTFGPNGIDIEVAGNWTETGGGFTPTAATVTFDGAGTSTITQLLGNNFYNVIAAKSGGGTVAVAGDVGASNNVTVNAGATLDVGTGERLGVGTALSVSGTLRLQGTTASRAKVGPFSALSTFDNFDDGSYIDGTPRTWTNSIGLWSITGAGYGATNGILDSDTTVQDIIRTASTQAYGTWEYRFKYDTFDTGNTLLYLRFLVAATNRYWVEFQGVPGADTFKLVKQVSGVPSDLASTTFTGNSGWYRVLVTRASNGDFTVKLYDSTEALVATLTANDNVNPVSVDMYIETFAAGVVTENVTVDEIRIGGASGPAISATIAASGTLDANGYAFESTNASGLVISDGATVLGWHNGTFTTNNGVYINLSAVTTANRSKIPYSANNVTFNGSTGNNVKASLTSPIVTFLGTLGTRAGESYDDDPAENEGGIANPGRVLWESGVVKKTPGGTYESIQDAVDAAVDGDVITPLRRNAVFGESVNLLGKNITLEGFVLAPQSGQAVSAGGATAQMRNCIVVRGGATVPFIYNCTFYRVGTTSTGLPVNATGGAATNCLIESAGWTLTVGTGTNNFTSATAGYFFDTGALDFHYKLPRTTASVAIGAATVPVDDTSTFPASGTGYLEGDDFTYTGKTATTLTGVTGVTSAHALGVGAVSTTVIDAGTAPAGFTSDFDGQTRPVDGNGVGGAQWDIGADEVIVAGSPRRLTNSAGVVIDPGYVSRVVLTSIGRGTSANTFAYAFSKGGSTGAGGGADNTLYVIDLTTMQVVAQTAAVGPIVGMTFLVDDNTATATWRAWIFLIVDAYKEDGSVGQDGYGDSIQCVVDLGDAGLHHPDGDAATEPVSDPVTDRRFGSVQFSVAPNRWIYRPGAAGAFRMRWVERSRIDPDGTDDSPEESTATAFRAEWLRFFFVAQRASDSTGAVFKVNADPYDATTGAAGTNKAFGETIWSIVKENAEWYNFEWRGTTTFNQGAAASQMWLVPVSSNGSAPGPEKVLVVWFGMNKLDATSSLAGRWKGLEEGATGAPDQNRYGVSMDGASSTANATYQCSDGKVVYNRKLGAPDPPIQDDTPALRWATKLYEGNPPTAVAVSPTTAAQRISGNSFALVGYANASGTDGGIHKIWELGTASPGNSDKDGALAANGKKRDLTTPALDDIPVADTQDTDWPIVCIGRPVYRVWPRGGRVFWGTDKGYVYAADWIRTATPVGAGDEAVITGYPYVIPGARVTWIFVHSTGKVVVGTDTGGVYEFTP